MVVGCRVARRALTRVAGCGHGRHALLVCVVDSFLHHEAWQRAAEAHVDDLRSVVGRELDREPAVLVVNQPTWGVDAGAAAHIRQALIDLAGRGSAILVISQDLDESFEIADRIAVISEGALSEPMPAAEATPEKIGLLMGGLHATGGEEASHAH